MIEILIWIKKHNIPLVSSIFVSETMSIVFWLYAGDLRDFKLLMEKKFLKEKKEILWRLAV